jgi:hypothetical protein
MSTKKRIARGFVRPLTVIVWWEKIVALEEGK